MALPYNYYTGTPYYSTPPLNGTGYGYSTPPAQQQQVTPGLMTIMVSSDEEVRNYPVAAGTTVLLIAFNLGKLWLKTTDTSGVPQKPREFSFTENVVIKQTLPEGITRDEFVSLSNKVNKLIEELGGTK